MQDWEAFLGDNFNFRPTFDYKLDKLKKDGKKITLTLKIKKLNSVDFIYARKIIQFIANVNIMGLSTKAIYAGLKKEINEGIQTQQNLKNKKIDIKNIVESLNEVNQDIDYLPKIQDYLNNEYPKLINLLAKNIISPDLNNAKLQDSYKQEGDLYPPTGGALLERMFTFDELSDMCNAWVNNSADVSIDNQVEELKKDLKPEIKKS